MLIAYVAATNMELYIYIYSEHLILFSKRLDIDGTLLAPAAVHEPAGKCEGVNSDPVFGLTIGSRI